MSPFLLDERNVPAAMVAVLGTPAVTVAGATRNVGVEADEADTVNDASEAEALDVVPAASATVEPAISAISAISASRNRMDRGEVMLACA